MNLRKMVEADRMYRELLSIGFTESRDGRPLSKLSFDELQTEFVRLPELKELEVNHAE